MSQDSNHLNSFVRGTNDWKHAADLTRNHSNPLNHKQCQMKYNDLKIQYKNMHNFFMLTSNSYNIDDEIIENNRYYFFNMIDVIKLIGIVG